MANEDRLKEILERQTTKAAKQRRFQDEAQRKAAETEGTKHEVATRWAEMRRHIEMFLQKLNERMRPNGVELFLDDPKSEDAQSARVDLVTIGFLSDKNEPKSARRLRIDVHASGKVNVEMGTMIQSSAKRYDLDVFKTDSDGFQQPIIDFLDINT
jgi:hypothetical protein